jgi:D-alanyl-D-alanine carboxypeptidase/D-alanyl-D-alanine-endopeptidase (penicillin-binding protein 4)
VRVEDASGTVLYNRNGERNFVPASNMKIFTTAAALALLGADFQYETRLDAVGEMGENGLWEGSLVIVGSGDPCLGSWHVPGEPGGPALLAPWVESIRAAGIRSIRGDIVGDGRAFTDEYVCGNWELEDYPFWYAAGSSGLAFEENCFRFTTSPGKQAGDRAEIVLNPDTAYVKVINETLTVEPGGTKNADIIWRNPRGNEIVFGGTVPLDAKPFEQRGSVWDSEGYAATLLREALQRAGIEVQGRAVNIRTLENADALDQASPEKRKALAVYTSPRLPEILKAVNKTSHNFFADQLLKTLGAMKKNRGDFEAGAEAVREWLQSIGAPGASDFTMLDGSGLAHRNLIQPAQACAALRAMHHHPAWRGPFWDSIAIAGVDGDLNHRMKEPPLKNNLRAKTGYIGQVRSLSGRVCDASGEPLFFSMIVNHHKHSISEADQLIHRACEALGKYSGKP